jgi:lipopolysaccharide transport system permease protein
MADVNMDARISDVEANAKPGADRKNMQLGTNIVTGDLAPPPSGKTLVFDTGASSQTMLAARDIYDGFSNFRLWSMIGWRDIKQRYRRSTLGPFWLTLSMAFMVTGLGLVYGRLFKMDLRTYLPFVCLGLILWDFISKSILEGSVSFLMLEGLIKQIRLPLTTHIASTIWRNVIVLAHNAVIYILVAAIFGLNPGWQALWFIPAFFLVVLNLTWVALTLAILCTRFRDVALIIQSVVQMLFFVTPVFWSSSLMPNRTVIVHGNPFYHMLQLLRAPLLGTETGTESWIFLLVMLFLGWTATFLLFTKFRRRIAYWL